VSDLLLIDIFCHGSYHPLFFDCIITLAMGAAAPSFKRQLFRYHAGKSQDENHIRQYYILHAIRADIDSIRISEASGNRTNESAKVLNEARGASKNG
jgi:hypothetical protein